MKKIAVVMGSDSDLPVVEKAINTLKEYGVPFEVHVYSAHRTPDEAAAAHLAGAMAARSTLPVVGIPVKSTNLDGVDALLSTVQMPSGMPVATVAINGAVNAALLCIQMLAITDEGLAAKLDEARKKGAEKVLAANKTVEEKFNA